MQKQSCNQTYNSSELDLVLKTRMQEENISRTVIQLNTHKSYEYETISNSISDLLRKVNYAFLKNMTETIIVPYASQVHFMGWIFRLTEGGILFMVLMNSQNIDLDEEIKIELIKKNVIVNEAKVKQQKYSDNCGVETIENYIGFLKGEDLLNRKISQDKAIEKHKLLRYCFDNQIDAIENSQEDTISMLKRLEIEHTNKRMLKEIKDLYDTKEDSLFIAKRMLMDNISYKIIPAIDQYNISSEYGKMNNCETEESKIMFCSRSKLIPSEHTTTPDDNSRLVNYDTNLTWTDKNE